MISAIILIIIIILLPPVGVAIMAGCGADLLINICLTILGYFPGHIHAFYLLYIQHSHRETGDMSKAGGVFSPRIYAPAGAKVQQPAVSTYNERPPPKDQVLGNGFDGTAPYNMQETGTTNMPYVQQDGIPYTRGGAAPPPPHYKA